VFARPFLIVTGTASGNVSVDERLLGISRFISLGHAAASLTSAPVPHSPGIFGRDAFAPGCPAEAGRCRPVRWSRDGYSSREAPLVADRAVAGVSDHKRHGTLRGRGSLAQPDRRRRPTAQHGCSAHKAFCARAADACCVRERIPGSKSASSPRFEVFRCISASGSNQGLTLSASDGPFRRRGGSRGGGGRRGGARRNGGARRGARRGAVAAPRALRVRRGRPGRSTHRAAVVVGRRSEQRGRGGRRCRRACVRGGAGVAFGHVHHWGEFACASPSSGEVTELAARS
jgi:hypothetical protein